METELIEGLGAFLRGLGFDTTCSSVFELRVWEGVAFQGLWVSVRPLVSLGVWEVAGAYASRVSLVGFEVPFEELAERIRGVMPSSEK